MLVIRRKPGESLVLGEDVEIEILEISGAQVKLGIRAPQSVRAMRKEILTVSRQNQASAAPISERHVEGLIAKFKKSSLGPISPV